MSKEAQVEQLTDYMAKFIAHVAKKLPDDVIAKLTELRAQAVSYTHLCRRRRTRSDLKREDRLERVRQRGHDPRGIIRNGARDRGTQPLYS